MLSPHLVALLLLATWAGAHADPGADRVARAEQFVRGVYGCDPGVVEDLAAEDVAITYPMFQEVFGKPVLRGRDAVRDFAAGFCERWADARVTFHESVEGGDRVVLVWSFRALNVAAGEESAWGGISLFRFDADGKIVAEIGEESSPGPAARLAGTAE
jgi:ketosteroid isomerase-like protein